MNKSVIGRNTLLDKETWRYIGIFETHPEWTIEEWRKNSDAFSGEKEEVSDKFLSCECCHKKLNDNEFPYMGAFSVAQKKFAFKIICKDCAYMISDIVTEADGTKIDLKHQRYGELIKYALKNYSQQPEFNYLVQRLGHIEEYWLYNDFDKAYSQMKKLAENNQVSYILEPFFIRGEWKTKRIFECFGNDVKYNGSDGDILLHVRFYTEAGNWMNPIKK